MYKTGRMKSKRNHRYALLAILVWMPLCMLAQSNVQRRADYFFNQFSFGKAIGYYEEMVDLDYNVKHAHKRLADCYLAIRDYASALPHLESFVEDEGVEEDYYLKYALALRSAGRSEESTPWFKKYKKLNKNDKRVDRFLEDASMANIAFNSRERFEVELANFNSEYSDFGTYVFRDTIYFASSREVPGEEVSRYGWNDEPWLDIYYVEESGNNTEVKRLPGNINSKYHDSNVSFTMDYKKDTVIFFTRNNYFQNKEVFDENKQNNLKIFKAERAKDGSWNVTRELTLNSDEYSTAHPFIAPGSKRLYFSSDRPGGYGGSDIYYSEILSRGGLSYPVNAGPVVNTEGNEMFPFVNAEGKLFFASDGHLGYGLLDIFATINSDNMEFVDVINLGKPLNSPADDFAFFADDEGINGYITSNRKGGPGGDDIYKFIYTPSLAVEGVVFDEVNGKRLDGVEVTLVNKNTGEEVSQATTGKTGYFIMYIDRQQEYRLVARRNTHPTRTADFSTMKTKRKERLIRQDINMNPILDVKLLADVKKIYFDFDKSDIRPDAAIELDKVVKLMTETYPNMVIRLEAHTDPVGSHEYNDKLSQRRATSTYWYLISKGVPKERILSYKGFGKRRPVNNCTGPENCTQEELELNRRTEFPIVRIR